MTTIEPVPRYGVRQQTASTDPISTAIEELRLLGYTVVDGGYSEDQIANFQSRFENGRMASFERYGVDRLKKLDEQNTIRCMLSNDRTFLELAKNERVMAICEAMIGVGFILNQQNGITNPANAATYSQAFYHRDLPYQHFTSSRPLAINALYCVDHFTEENGSTLVLPATHKDEAFPSDAFVRRHEVQATASAGSFILLDCMLYHCGGRNRSSFDRRAVNHVYTTGLMRQQIDFPAFLGESYTSDPVERRLLGYDYNTPRSPEDHYSLRERKLKNN